MGPSEPMTVPGKNRKSNRPIPTSALPLKADIWRAGQNTQNSRVECSRKAKMSALSKVEMSVSAPFWEFGGCYFDGHRGDEQART
jgi:hypothetical protein